MAPSFDADGTLCDLHPLSLCARAAVSAKLAGGTTAETSFLATRRRDAFDASLRTEASFRVRRL